MTSLSGKSYKVTAGDETYELGICSPPGKPCLENAGICQTTKGQSASLGVISRDLVSPESAAPYLMYTSGGACGNLSNHWRTKIEFICEPDTNKNGMPKVIENKDCLMIIQFPTKLACQDQVIWMEYIFLLIYHFN